VLLIIAGLNVVIFAVAGTYLWDRLSDQAERITISELAATLRGSISPRGANVANILGWPGWSEVEDAFLVDRNLTRRSDGSLQARGIALHPVGSQRRDADATLDVLLAGLELGMRRNQTIPLAGGSVIPIEIDDEVWGACWYRLRSREDPGSALRLLLPWFAISTALLTGGSFFALKRLVLEPVSKLAGGAREMQAGRLDVEVQTTGRGDELDGLVASFNGMASQVASFNRELEERVAEATEQARRAEQAAMVQQRLAAMGELAAGIAHEINNPLGGLQNAVASLRKPDLPPERSERYLDLLGSGLERIRGIVGQVLRMAPREVRAEPVDLCDAIEDSLALVRHRAERSEVEIDVRIAEGTSSRVHGSRNELGQAVLNLLVNALDAVDSTDGAGRIVVRVAAHDSASVALEVEDNGPGVDAPTLQRAQDLFFTTKDPGKGTGLGLAIVHNVADTHGGRLELESEPDRFFRARLVLPLDASDGRSG
jgi:signal transduction histidine kinase